MEIAGEMKNDTRIYAKYEFCFFAESFQMTRFQKHFAFIQSGLVKPIYKSFIIHYIFFAFGTFTFYR